MTRNLGFAGGIQETHAVSIPTDTREPWFLVFLMKTLKSGPICEYSPKNRGFFGQFRRSMTYAPVILKAVAATTSISTGLRDNLPDFATLDRRKNQEPETLRANSLSDLESSRWIGT
jgi:hypothetical protein